MSNQEDEKDSQSVLTTETDDTSESLQKAHEEIRLLRGNIKRLEAKFAELSQPEKPDESSDTNQSSFYQEPQNHRQRHTINSSRPIDPPSFEPTIKVSHHHKPSAIPQSASAAIWFSGTKKFRTRSLFTKGTLIYALISILFLISFGSLNNSGHRDAKQKNEFKDTTSVNPQIRAKQLIQPVGTTTVTSEGEVPVVYTFFDDLDNVYDKNAEDGQGEGEVKKEEEQKGNEIHQSRRRLKKKTTTRDRDILQAWKDAWSAMGYIPRVLTLEDARRHPDYESYSEILDKKVPLGSNKEYDKACYLRWLAMATSGGLLMSDFDTVPLTPPQPGDLVPPERFTFHQGFIPSFLKGTPEQWTTIAHAILEEATHPDRADLGLYSDMLALRELIKNPDTQELFHVMKPETVQNAMPFLEVEENPISKAECRAIAKLRAVHFQHRSEVIKNDLTNSIIEGSEYKSRRASLMSRWSEFWPEFFKEHCPDTKSPWS